MITEKYEWCLTWVSSRSVWWTTTSLRGCGRWARTDCLTIRYLSWWQVNRAEVVIERETRQWLCNATGYLQQAVSVQSWKLYTIVLCFIAICPKLEFRIVHNCAEISACSCNVISVGKWAYHVASTIMRLALGNCQGVFRWDRKREITRFSDICRVSAGLNSSHSLTKRPILQITAIASHNYARLIRDRSRSDCPSTLLLFRKHWGTLRTARKHENLALLLLFLFSFFPPPLRIYLLIHPRK